MFKLNRLQQGFVSLLMLLILSFLSWIGLSTFYKVSSQERIVRYEAYKGKAVFLADSGIQWAKASLVNDPDWKGGTKTFQSGKVEVEVTKSNQSYRVIARSESEKMVQARYGDFSRQNNTLVLIGYGVLYN